MTFEGKLDPQVEEAIHDITNSFKMLTNLSDPEIVYVDKVQLMEFHKLRIKNCLDALGKSI